MEKKIKVKYSHPSIRYTYLTVSLVSQISLISPSVTHLQLKIRKSRFKNSLNTKHRAATLLSRQFSEPFAIEVQSSCCPPFSQAAPPLTKGKPYPLILNSQFLLSFLIVRFQFFIQSIEFCNWDLNLRRKTRGFQCLF